MKKTVCFAPVFVLSSIAWASRSEKLRNNLEKSELKRELKREIAQEKKKANAAKKDL